MDRTMDILTHHTGMSEDVKDALSPGKGAPRAECDANPQRKSNPERITMSTL